MHLTVRSSRTCVPLRVEWRRVDRQNWLNTGVDPEGCLEGRDLIRKLNFVATVEGYDRGGPKVQWT